MKDIRVVVNGAGAAGIGTLKLITAYGVKAENCTLCDSQGVIYTGREDVNPYKKPFARDTMLRTLADALKGADVFIGVSAAGALKKEYLETMAEAPIIFALANPEPEIRPEVAKKIRPDAIIATGRSDYPNQLNNIQCFPYLTRAALDTRAKCVNQEMKLAAAQSLAMLAREPVPAEVSSAYSGQTFEFGPDYIVPTPFDPRLISTVPMAVAKAAIDSGVARAQITNWTDYRHELEIKTLKTSY